MKNILIINAHWNNRGDQAAIYAMLDELLCVLKLRETGDMQKGTAGRSFFVYHLSFLFLIVDFCALKRYNCKQLMN